MKWEPNAVKARRNAIFQYCSDEDWNCKQAQLRLTTQRLGQLQAKHDSQAAITRTDIATLVQRGNVPLAREKAEKLIQDETFGDVMEVVEMQIGVVLEHFHELEHGIPPSPVMVEASSTILYAAPFINSKDLDVIRNFLSQALGPDFTRSATGNREGYVARRVLKALSAPVPSAYQLDYYLNDITKAYGIPWSPDPPPREFIVNALSECLDSEASPEVDLPRLRKLCERGLPDEPAWLRPRVWKLLFGIVSKTKVAWKAELTKQRDSYYDLVRRLLEPFSQTSGDLDHLDSKLSDVFKELSGLPRDVFALLEEEPDDLPQCPLNEDAPDDIRIPYAQILEVRLKEVHEPAKEREASPMPEIRLEPEVEALPRPGISLTSFDSGLPEGSTLPKTLLASRKCMFGTAHPKHCSALLRLLYLHNTLNPLNASSHTASLLVPLYSAMIQEIEIDDLAHVEADVFWLLEAIVAEFSELEDEGGKVWLTKLSQRVSWGDYEFYTELESRGLDPGLPHYSYRWLAPVLTHTVPVTSLFLVWDALFSRDLRDKGSNPKLEYLVDICMSMILRGKNHLHRTWKAGQVTATRSLWVDETDVQSQSQISENAFLESLSFLQTYDLKLVGGIERVLQTAAEMSQRRIQESNTTQQPSLGLGARFNLWRGYGPQPTSNSTQDVDRPPPPPPKDATLASNPSRVTGLASSLTTTVWRGITNQSAMDDDLSVPPSPEPEAPPQLSAFVNAQSPPATSAPSALFALPSASSPASYNIWGYAEKIKGSDALATISKVGTNWRAKGLLNGWSSASNSPAPTHTPLSPDSPKGNSLPSSPPQIRERSGSIPFAESPGLLSPPLSRFGQQSPTPTSPQSAGGLVEKTKYYFTTRSPPGVPVPKSAPKPLLLNRTSVVVGHNSKPSLSLNSNGHQPRSASTPDSAGKDEWAEVMRLKKQHFHRDSQSSVSSLSPSDAFGRVPKSSKSDWESDTAASRVVPLNRRSISPMAPTFHRPSSRASSASSDIHSPPIIAKSPLQESSSLIGFTAGIASSTSASSDKISDAENTDNTLDMQPPSRKASWKTVTSSQSQDDDSPAAGPTRTARVRTKRYPRPANLQIQDNGRPNASAEQKSTSPANNLTVEWPGDEQESITTPKAGSFDSDDQVSIPAVRSPRRTRKVSTGDPSAERPRKPSTDGTNEERPRKLSSRMRKMSTENRETPKNRRESAAHEGDDEGYDDLLSAYESEDGPKRSSIAK